MDTNDNRKFEVNGKEVESLEDVSAELREAFRKALASWRIPAQPVKTAYRFNQEFGPGVNPETASGLRPQARKTAPIPTRARANWPSPLSPPSGPAGLGRPFFIRVLTWIVFWAIVVLLFRLFD